MITPAAEPIPAAIARLAGGSDEIVPIPGEGACLFAADPSVASLCNVVEVATWLAAANLRYPQFTVIEGGVTLPPSSVTSSRSVMGRLEEGFPDVRAIAAAVRRGATAQIAELETWHVGARHLCRELASLTRLRAGAVAFLTGRGEYGLQRHRDDAHVFAVQIAGSKCWELFDDLGGEAACSVTLRPGQGLYVPLGTIHQARAGAQGSFHISFTLRPLSAREAAQALFATFSASIAADARLDGTREERLRRLDELLGRIASWADAVDRVAALDGLEQRLLTGPTEPGDVLHSLIAELGAS